MGAGKPLLCAQLFNLSTIPQPPPIPQLATVLRTRTADVCNRPHYTTLNAYTKTVSDDLRKNRKTANGPSSTCSYKVCPCPYVPSPLHYYTETATKKRTEPSHTPKHLLLTSHLRTSLRPSTSPGKHASFTRSPPPPCHLPVIPFST